MFPVAIECKAVAIITLQVAFLVCSLITSCATSASEIVSGRGPSSRIDPAKTKGTLFLTQLKALVLVSIFAFVGSYILFFIVNKITPLRVTEEKEELGLDISQHGEFL